MSTYIRPSVLALPEILSEIFTWIDMDYSAPHRQRDLLNCALVDKAWCHEALRILWSDTRTSDTLERLMIKIPINRRQIYANFVKRARVSSYNLQAGPVAFGVMENVIFPQLHTLDLLLGHCNGCVHRFVYVPDFKMPSLRTLHISGTSDINRNVCMDQGEWDYMASRILEVFPRLVNVLVEIPTVLDIEGFEAFAEKLPKLQSLAFEELVSPSELENGGDTTEREDTDNEDTEIGSEDIEMVDSDDMGSDDMDIDGEDFQNAVSRLFVQVKALSS
ncbi:hypothetical protein N7457_008270 [Penicillium paradoxum]|uniref:uncharacterized protein n=1 Tax=Penicillium paradoxum TaxID=176176 RepID=UPI002546F14C|nr:uncharacterized protein N7457_008270 [Penicillium paradoxum]KAJ5773374.1 hypothetical protein N7457_008270 [Penicillium paradoxum]